MYKCNESNNCPNSGKSFGEGNVNARDEINHNGSNGNGRNYNDPMRKDVNNISKTNENNNCTGSSKGKNFNSFDEFLMRHSILHSFLSDQETNNGFIFNGKCPSFDSNREKCKNCKTFSNENDSDIGEKEEFPNFMEFLHTILSEEIEEDQNQNESSDDNNTSSEKVLVHIANTVDYIQTTVSEMSEMYNGDLTECASVDEVKYDESFNKINRKLSKMNRRIKDLDAKLDIIMDAMPTLVASTLIHRLKEIDEMDAKNKNKK